ncbi:hypothetical protein [Mycolicibacterium sphagni]|uniref:Uncharacterized protein n=1 Tax=Mycolicibacterium sphagni TaxID=1786 RepID=A0A255DUQ3_9MYCO|nr:hypothetical protein [Mycolicibacterium sphagni]OYN82954.1 hypothetical protein CG716_01795 [Mycolicibacterium sphagni]
MTFSSKTKINPKESWIKMAKKRHKGPLGPNGSWKQGQRVPVGGQWIDQFGRILDLTAHFTFPPIPVKGECTFWKLYEEAA